LSLLLSDVLQGTASGDGSLACN